MALDIANIAVASALVYGLLQGEAYYRRYRALKIHRQYLKESDEVFHPKVVRHRHTVVGGAEPIKCVDCAQMSHNYHTFSDGTTQCLNCAKRVTRIHNG